MRVTAILLMASLLVGATTSAVPAHAWTAELFSAPSSAPLLARADAAPGSPAVVDSSASGSGPRASFPVVALPATPRRHAGLALGCAVSGAALVASSFAWRNLGDRRYDEYLAETDPSRIESRWNATRRADQVSNASLVAGEVLLVGAVWLRFVRGRHDAPVALRVEPDRAAFVVRW